MSTDINHYENFPVASWLCPPRLRPAIAAIYHFARTADDLADEGDVTPEKRLDDLAAYKADLQRSSQQKGHCGRWPQVFEPLERMIVTHSLPVSLLADLLDAFCQDIEMTRDQQRYANFAQLQNYCRRSANPVGRLLLHLYGLKNEEDLSLSDDICTALQLINFWQDLSQDIPRGRYYLTQEDCATFGVMEAEMKNLKQTPGATSLIANQTYLARAMMLKGSKLVHRIPGRAGWELRGVVQGGLRILDKIEALNFATFQTRPTIGRRDAPLLVWRCLWM